MHDLTPPADGTSSLLEAVLQISSGQDLRGALDRLVRASCELTGARYGVLGILDEDSVVSDFVIHGVDAETTAKIASLPTCQGVLGVLVEEPCPLRLSNVADHARSMGFPPNHPPMTSFLGVPVLVDGAVYGNLYLTEKAGGSQFTAEDEELLEVLARIAGFVIANARSHELGARRQRWLESSIAMGHELGTSADLEHALGLVAARLRVVAGADLVVVAEHLDAEAHLVAADSGPLDISVADLTDLVASAEVGLAKAAADGEVVVLARPGRAGLYVVPLLSRLVPGHSLLVELAESGVGLAADPELLAAFADQAALALDRTQGLVERQEHMLVADRDRIARDLHDTVIQRLFATALQLQGLRRTTPAEPVRQRLDDAVNELSTTIRDIRSTIFELKHDEGASLKSEIRGLARDYVPVLGFAPFVRIRGPVDAVVAPEVADHLIATLREALSNVARHSEASACVVEVEVGSDLLVLRVADDGKGIGRDVLESGLQNLRLRATELGGEFTIARDEPQGTVLEWRVPVGR